MDIDAFMSAISAQESSGNPNAVNSRTQAHGLFQIMPNNWSPWAKEAGLGANAARTPENQTKVARHKMQQYYDQFGSWDAVAVAWFAGPGRARRYVNGDTSVLELSDGNMKVGDYIRKMQQGMGRTAQGGVGGEAIRSGEVPNVNPTTGEDFRGEGTDPAEMWRTILTTLADQQAGGQREPLEAVLANDDLGAASAVVSEGGEEGSEDLLNDAIARWTPQGGSEAPEDQQGSADAISERSSSSAADGDLVPEFKSGLDRLIEDAPGRVTITSGYRSPERQKVLWERALKKYGSESAARKWVAPPGNSQHNHGKAADLKFENDEVRRWVHANAARYGLHFPLSNEPWHVEVEGSRS